MPSPAAPSSNWAKLQQVGHLRAIPANTEKLPAPSSSTSKKDSKSKKGKDNLRSLNSSGSTAGPSSSRNRYTGVAAFVRGNDEAHKSEAGPSAVTINVPAPSIKEGVVFKPLANPTSLQIELREMVAGRNPLNEARRAPGNYIAIDCEMVGLGHLGAESALARVSLVNYHGHIVLDTFVAPRERVTDWRTWVSGVREEDILGAPSFEEVQKKVAELIEGKVMVGHAIENDFKALLLNHPGPMVRDTQKCKALREIAKTKRPGLKKLCEMELGLEIQKGAHSSVTDARATMALYRLHKVEWEKQIRPTTEAYRAKTAKIGGKRKRGNKEGEEDEDDDDEEGEQSKGGKGKRGTREETSFPGGGRKGVSSGLGMIIRKNGVRIDQRTGKVLEGKKGGVGGVQGRSDAREQASSGRGGGDGGSNWWE